MTILAHFGAALAAVWISTSTAAANDFKMLDDAALRSALSGKTVRLDTRIGSIPISFRADGTMTGRAPDLVSYLGRGYDTGTWWIDDNRLCQKWKLWLDGESYCFTIRQSGQTVQWTRNDGVKGTLQVAQ
jgi:hypothetical protein